MFFRTFDFLALHITTRNVEPAVNINRSPMIILLSYSPVAAIADGAAMLTVKTSDTITLAVVPALYSSLAAYRTSYVPAASPVISIPVTGIYTESVESLYSIAGVVPVIFPIEPLTSEGAAYIIFMRYSVIQILLGGTNRT